MIDAVSVPSLAEELPWVDHVEEGDWLAAPAAKIREEGIDKREFKGDPIDCGWIGETDGGIWLKRHPEAALTEMPALWAMHHRWQLGLHDVTREDLETLSNHETEQLAAMASAHAREQKRRMRRGDEEAEDRD